MCKNRWMSGGSASQEEHPLADMDVPAPTAQKAALRLIHLNAYVNAARESTGLRVLDIGCNDGYGTMLLARQARRVVGVDVSSRAIDAALARGAMANVEFRRVDGLQLPFDDGSFDLATVFQVIEHIEDTREFLEEIRRVLAPAGRAIFTTPNAAIRLDPGMRPWNPYHVREYTASELVLELQPVFRLVTVHGLCAPVELASIERSRVATARARARYRNNALARVIVKLLPDRARTALGRLGPSGRPSPPTFALGLTAEDLWLSEDDLDEALDLRAVCEVARVTARGLPDAPTAVRS